MPVLESLCVSVRPAAGDRGREFAGGGVWPLAAPHIQGVGVGLCGGGAVVKGFFEQLRIFRLRTDV